MMKSKGITLIELLVVISIIGILVIVLAFNFQNWMARYKVEDITKQLQADITTARTRAITTRRSQFIQVNLDSYAIFEDTNPADGNDIFDGADTQLPSFPKNTPSGYTFVNLVGGVIIINKKGNITPIGDIQVQPDINADYDCIDVRESRINIGKWNIPTAGICNER